nr:hypothetical protein [Tanacetum cinerariifolium]
MNGSGCKIESDGFGGLCVCVVEQRRKRSSFVKVWVIWVLNGRGQALEKVIGVDLFYLRSMDRGTANVPYLLAQYLFRHAERRKSRATLFGGHFIGCLAAHFRLVSDQGLRGLLVVTHELPLLDLHELGRLKICERIGDMSAWVASGPERQPDAGASAPRAAKDALAVNKNAQADPAPVHAPQPAHMTMP